jgi:hypothetical protein
VTAPSLETLGSALAGLDEAGREALAAWLAERGTPLPDAPRPDTHRVRGRLLFQDWKPGHARRPLHHFDVEVWEHGLLGRHARLAAGRSGLDGAFELAYAAPAHPHHRLELRVVEQHRAYGPHGEPEATPHTVHAETFHDPPLTLDLGDLEVPFWPYCYAGPLPRVLIPPGAEPPQDYARGRKTALVKTVAELGLVRTRHLLAHKVAPTKPALATIQADYPENLTLRLEREHPGHTRSDAFFVDRVLNGLNPCLPVADRREPGLWRVAFDWNGCEMDGVHVLPNAELHLRREGDSLVPVRLTIQCREPGVTAAHGPMQPARVVTPADGAAWQQAKRLFRCAWALHGQIVAHLSVSHLNVEQYAVAAYRNLRGNPIRDLLFPHLREVVLINHGGADLIFGERGYVTTASALTASAVDGLFLASLGRCDWVGWRPRQALTPGHTFGHAATLFWEVLTRHVDEFLAAHRAAIAAHWVELRLMSDELVAHAVPHVPPDLGPHDEPLDPGELGDRTAPRAERDGVLKAVRPFTTGDIPTDADWAALAQVCRYVIYHATFYHAWANDRQHDDGGELRYAALSLRGDGWGDEADDAIAQTPAEATDQIFLSMFLQLTGYGYVLRNEDHDIPPRFVELLREHEPAFRAIGFDPATIRSRINI